MIDGRGGSDKYHRACDIAEKLVLTKTADFMFKVNFLMLFANVMGTADTMKAIVNLTVLRRIREDTNNAGIDLQELEIQEQVIGRLDLHGAWTEFELDQTEGFYDVGVGDNVSRTRKSYVPATNKKVGKSDMILTLVFIFLLGFYCMIEKKISMISAEKIALEDLFKRANAEFPNDGKIIELYEKYKRLFKESKRESAGKDVVNDKKDGVNAEKDGVNAVQEGEADVNEEPKDMLEEETFTQWIKKYRLGWKICFVWPRAVQPISVVCPQTLLRVVTRSSPNKRIVKSPTYLTSRYINKRIKVTSLIKRLEFVLGNSLFAMQGDK
nr:ulp1 protease family, C-terminal catalytic domain-containing protein [Tanacetum cinerariifolium]